MEEQLKVLNLYCGLGGNRKKWKNCKVTAVEINPTIAKYYQDKYPEDEVIIGDAHEYLLKNYRFFDFIWSSINCPSHSRARFWATKGGGYDPIYPDFKLYEEIYFLKYFCDKQKWLVENVTPYYQKDIPKFMEPTIKLERHLFWSNFDIGQIEIPKNSVHDGSIKGWQEEFGIDITSYKFSERKDKILRNCVHPDLGLHVYNEMRKSLKEIEPIKTI